MKICFSVSVFPALSQTFVTTQVLYAVRQGHEVTVTCQDYAPDTPLSEDVRAALEQVRIVIWPRRKPLLLGLLPTGWADRIVARLRRDLWRRTCDADLVIAHFGYRGAAVARAQRGWHGRPPLVTIFHGRDVSVEHRRSGLSRYEGLFDEGDLHLTVNAPFADLLVQSGAPAERVATHHLGIPVAQYAFFPPQPRSPYKLLSVSRLVDKKGLHVAIAALGMLHAAHPGIDWQYAIGGDGPLSDALQQQVIDAGLQDRVAFLGPLSHEQTLHRIAEADALLVPSVTASDGDQEGIPVTLMEAMALGTPVCTTRHSGIPELVSHRESGLLSDEHDIEGLCANILALFQDPALATQLATAARRKVENDFNEDRQNAQLLARCLALIA